MIDPLLAVVAGLLTVAAPCVLPMLPVVLGASVGQTSRARPAFIAAGFALAFASVALLFSVFTSVLGLSQETLRQAAIAMLLAFGLLMLWPQPFYWLTARMNGMLNRVNAVGGKAGSGNLGGLVLGLSLGALWTPCAGPVLGSILTLIATSPDIGKAALLLACYSVGAAIPMLAIAYGGQYATTRVRQLTRHTQRMQQAFGVVIVVVAVAMQLQWDSVATVWLSGFYPGFATGL
ncbi:cytochrome c biogenesis CcdA family protein [Ramlibacter sp. WS9]|uniref:cytochrome c biogenesis CcdA family protein n=1 Tax=Ramlibacter sp. WS9 TaxID=1882741 RepID=UPI0011413613|nr:cytochrome c biogenesis CcdA family protein [Ramlibacter sp. WS9]ROZ64519.1 cytochrome c biogenesis protein CcdA [Ramlibacter sp. WS9]